MATTAGIPLRLPDAQHALAEQQRLIEQQQATIAQQEATIARLQARIAELEQQLAEAQRAAKRQAAPFAKGPPKAQPKTPGQKLGHRAAHRPTPARIDRTLEAALPAHCPACGGQVVEDTVQAQYQEDIPRPVRTVITQFNPVVCTQGERRAYRALHGVSAAGARPTP